MVFGEIKILDILDNFLHRTLKPTPVIRALFNTMLSAIYQQFYELIKHFHMV